MHTVKQIKINKDKIKKHTETHQTRNSLTNPPVSMQPPMKPVCNRYVTSGHVFVSLAFGIVEAHAWEIKENQRQ